MERILFHKMTDKTYIGIITLLDYEMVLRRCLSEITLPLVEGSSNKVIVDMALKVGFNQYRFVSFDINENGKIAWSSNEYINPEDKIVKYANDILKENKEIVSHSMLSSVKKEEVLNI